MNKKEFINNLSDQLSYSIEECIIINEILENNFWISKKNKDKVIEEIMNTLNRKQEEALKIYDTAISIIKEEVKNKLKHPFKNQD